MWFAGPFPWLWGIHLYMAERSFVYEGKKSAFLNWSKSLQFISWHADNEWQHLAHVPLNMTGTPFSGEDKLKCPAASLYGLPWWLSSKEFTRSAGNTGFNPSIRKIPWRRKWHTTPVFLPGKPHGQRSLVGYGPWGHKSLTWLGNWTTKKNYKSM